MWKSIVTFIIGSVVGSATTLAVGYVLSQGEETQNEKTTEPPVPEPAAN